MEASTSPSVRDGESADPAGAEEVLAAAGLSASELSECVRVLSRIEQAQELGTLDPNASCLRSLRKVLSQLSKQTFAHLPQKSQLDENERKRAEKDRKRERRQRQLEADKRFQENTQLRASRLAKLQALEESEDVEKLQSLCCGAHAQLRIPDGPASMEAEDCTTSPVDDGEQEYCRQQACYICKVRFSERHHFYSHLCPACAALNFEKRHQARDLFGRIGLVTGARVKIGFQVATKLLRMGARVLATSRFPQDARKRYMAEPDAEQWLDRLEIIGADFRFLGGVEAMCAQLKSREPFLDIIVNNACQTVRRPAAYYAHLLRDEAPPSNPSLPYGPYPSLAGQRPQFELEPQGPGREQAEQAEQLRELTASPGFGDSAALSQLLVLEEDKDLKEDTLSLPSGMRDVHGQQLDLRSTNSWLLKLGEVETPEAVEVFCINAMAPFIINSRLRGLLERSPHPDRYIINVSAMEGKFYRYKQPTHPHTNMAKAALNMMTRTSAEDLASNSGIFMNSVDTGWINDENPLPTAQRIAENHQFQTPIDEVDAAARILDPVLMGLDAVKSGHAPCRGRVRKGGAEELGDGPVWGCFLKDYKLSEW